MDSWVAGCPADGYECRLDLQSFCNLLRDNCGFSEFGFLALAHEVGDLGASVAHQTKVVFDLPAAFGAWEAEADMQRGMADGGCQMAD